jgi:hypothetical protein
MYTKLTAQTTTIGQQATTIGQQTTTIDQQTTEQVNSFNEQSIMELKIIYTMLHYVKGGNGKYVN